jgi:hypothetical protein
MPSAVLLGSTALSSCGGEQHGHGRGERGAVVRCEVLVWLIAMLLRMAAPGWHALDGLQGQRLRLRLYMHGEEEARSSCCGALLPATLQQCMHGHPACMHGCSACFLPLPQEMPQQEVGPTCCSAAGSSRVGSEAGVWVRAAGAPARCCWHSTCCSAWLVPGPGDVLCSMGSLCHQLILHVLAPAQQALLAYAAPGASEVLPIGHV